MAGQETLLPRFQRSIVVHTPHYSVRPALEEMHKNGYSQVVARDHKGRLRLISYEALGRIMARAWDDDYVDIKHRGIDDYLPIEPEGTMVIMSGDRTRAEATEILMRLSTPPVYAILITDSGNDRGTPLGIITHADLRT
jgi:CBS domain-containing protein